ncbi:MAG: DUF2835 domain-containing protein [Gammaproteobacteria bacterium]|nr:DUF2835 domain-containing protein [Gammaproteobacteria bacterium]
MKESKCVINISAEKLLSYYRGNVRNVIAKSADGTTIQFPVEILRPFIMHNGVSGVFVIRYDDNNKLVDIEKTSELKGG